MASRHRSWPVALRLSRAFIAVALAAVALLAALTAAFAANDVGQLVATQRVELAQATSVAAAAAWSRTGSWRGANLQAALDLAARVGSQVQVADDAGRIVGGSPGFATGQGPVRHAAVVVHGRPVGSVDIRFTQTGFASADHKLRTALWRAIAVASALAALLALMVALGVASHITRPVARLMEVTRAMGRGDWAARVGSIRAPAELRDLAATFDKMADTLVRQEQLRRDLVANVAHELRTPVAVLQAGHEALLDGVTEPTPAQLSSLRDEVLRLARMVDDLQMLAAAEAAALRLSPREHDLAALAAAAADGMASQAQAAGLTVQRQLQPACVLVDDRWMYQAIMNLISNAVKFTPAGGRVTLATGVAAGSATLTVTDTGIGIPADELPHVFDRLWRGSNPLGAAGSGIGLAVVAELVHAHEGSVEASSAPGRGTSVTITLPRA